MAVVAAGFGSVALLLVVVIVVILRNRRAARAVDPAPDLRTPLVLLGRLKRTTAPAQVSQDGMNVD